MPKHSQHHARQYAAIVKFFLEPDDIAPGESKLLDELDAMTDERKSRTKLRLKDIRRRRTAARLELQNG